MPLQGLVLGEDVILITVGEPGLPGADGDPGSGALIIAEDAVALPGRGTLNFSTGIVATDNPGADSIDVTVSTDTISAVPTSDVGAPNGVASLDGTGKVPSGQLPAQATGSITDINGDPGPSVVLDAADVGAVDLNQLAAANGVATLDSGSHIPDGQIPTAITRDSELTAAVAGLQPVDATLTALAAYNTAGLLTQTAADTFAGRTLTGTAARVAVTNGSGVGGNPTVDIDATYVGQTSITTLGTIATGTWQGTTLALNKGGTGQTTATAGFDALAPTSARGDLVVRDASNNVRLPVGGAATILRSDGTDAAWASLATAGIQPLDTDLTALAAITEARGSLITGGVSGWQGLTVGTSGTILRSDGTDAAWASLSTAGIQPLDADLTAVAAITEARGSLITGGASNWQGLTIGSAGTLLRSDGTDVAWASLATAGIQPLDATLTSLAAYNTNGLVTQTAADTFTGRTITGTSNRLAVTNGSGVSGNPTLDIDTAYVGQATITTLGTIGTGTWNGGIIPVAYGGTATATGFSTKDDYCGTTGDRQRGWEDFENVTATTTDATIYGTTGTVAVSLSGTAAGTGAQQFGTDLIGTHVVAGVGQLTSGTSTTGKAGLLFANRAYNFQSVDTIKFFARLRIPTLSDGTNTFIVRAGFMNAANAAPANGIFIEANAGANWRCRTMAASASTPDSDSGVTVTTNYINVAIIYDGTSAHFYMSSGVSTMTEVVTAISTGFPANATSLVPSISIVKSAGATARTVNIDAMGWDTTFARGMSQRI